MPRHKRKQHSDDDVTTSDESDLTSGDDSSDAERRKRKKHPCRRGSLLEVKQLIKDIKHDEKIRKKKFGSGKKNPKKPLKGGAASHGQLNRPPQKRGENPLKKELNNPQGLDFANQAGSLMVQPSTIEMLPFWSKVGKSSGQKSTSQISPCRVGEVSPLNTKVPLKTPVSIKQK